MSLVRINNCDIYYELHGSGQSVVFIHGESHCTELFDLQIPYFSQTCQCLVYDRRGHGRSQVPPYGFSLWNQTYDLTCLLDHLHIRTAIVVAVAMSTTIAVTLALHNPDRVKALVLCSWYELDGYPLLEQRRKKHKISFGELHVTMFEILRMRGRQGLVDYINDPAVFPIFPDDKPSVRKKLVDIFSCHESDHYLKSAEFYTSLPNIRAQLDQLRCPVLGICGTDDPSPDRPELLQYLPDFRQVWIKDARRFTMMEYPEEFNAVLAEFIRRVS